MQSWNSSLWRRHTFICLELFFFLSFFWPQRKFIYEFGVLPLGLFTSPACCIHLSSGVNTLCLIATRHKLSSSVRCTLPHTELTETLNALKGGWSAGAVVAPKAPAVDSDPSFADWWSWLRLLQPWWRLKHQRSPLVVRTSRFCMCGGGTEVMVAHIKLLFASVRLNISACSGWKRCGLCSLALISLWTPSELTFLVHAAPLERWQDWLQVILQIF